MAGVRYEEAARGDGYGVRCGARKNENTKLVVLAVEVHAVEDVDQRVRGGSTIGNDGGLAVVNGRGSCVAARCRR